MYFEPKNSSEFTLHYAGYYMYTEASAPRKNGDFAQIETKWITYEPHCFSLWYNMNGRNIGKLTVRMIFVCHLMQKLYLVYKTKTTVIMKIQYLNNCLSSFTTQNN